MINKKKSRGCLFFWIRYYYKVDPNSGDTRISNHKNPKYAGGDAIRLFFLNLNNTRILATMVWSNIEFIEFAAVTFPHKFTTSSTLCSWYVYVPRKVHFVLKLVQMKTFYHLAQRSDILYLMYLILWYSINLNYLHWFELLYRLQTSSS